MKNDQLFFAAVFAVLLVVYEIGWITAHDTVASECDRLGGFFVGSKVYECNRKVSTK